MKKQEFLKYLDDLGLTTDFLGIHIGDKPDYSPYYRECCYKDGDVWVRYIINERGHMIVFNKTNEDECFNHMKAVLPDLLSDNGIHNVQKTGAYALTKRDLINYLMDNYDMNEQRAEEQYETFRKNINLLMEFKKYVKENIFMAEKYALSPCGWTAEKLYEKFPLSPLGAFNYINYLIENPDAAMKNLEIGLKNKDTIRML